MSFKKKKYTKKKAKGKFCYVGEKCLRESRAELPHCRALVDLQAVRLLLRGRNVIVDLPRRMSSEREERLARTKQRGRVEASEEERRAPGSC